jgi:hypothetical protein
MENLTKNDSKCKSADEMAEALDAKRSGSGWIARCVSHDDQNPSLSISEGSNSKVLIKCHAGCSQDLVISRLKELGLWFQSTIPTKIRDSKEYKPVAHYIYKDESGQPALQITRQEASDGSKKIIQQYFKENTWCYGGIKNLTCSVTPYRFFEWKDSNEPIYLPEGEKCADFLASKGFNATATPGGANGWNDLYSKYFEGKDVIIIPDNDEPGRKYCEAVKISLMPICKSLRVVDLPGLATSEDIIDWAKRGGKKDALLDLVSKTPIISLNGTQIDSNIVKISDVEIEEVEWLWYPYIPKNKSTIIEGDPGIGKSFITLAMATALSIGQPLPGSDESKLAKTLMFNSEDGLGDTLKPRLKAMGADDSNIYSYKIPLVLDDAGKRIIENAIRTIQPALVTLDPLSAVIGSDVDIYKANQVRPFMTFISQLAEKYNCAIVLVRHLTKGGKDSAIYRGSGSIDFVGACRSALLVGCDPDDRSNRALVHIKSNLAPFGDALGYRIDNGRFVWAGKSNLTASRILSPAAKEEDTSALTEAEDFLKEFLEMGAQSSQRVESNAEAKGISKATLRRASQAIGIVKIRQGEDGKRGGGKWIWRLPDLDAQDLRTENLSTLIPKPEIVSTLFETGVI